ncbi:MAG: hypothetical protein ACRDHZ_00545 [Ktedonobacteraceae bacterium]
MTDKTRPQEWRAPKKYVEQGYHASVPKSPTARINIIGVAVAVCLASIGWGGSWVASVSTRVTRNETSQKYTAAEQQQFEQQMLVIQQQNYQAIQAQLAQISAQIHDLNARMDAQQHD